MNGTRFSFPTLATLLAALMFAPAAFGADRNDDSGSSEAASPALETQAYLGLGVGPLHPALLAQLPDVTGKGRGILVEHVMKESPAAKAGLQQHDVLIRYDKQELYSPEQLVKLVRNDEPGREVALGYVRGGKVQEATVRLGEVPAREQVRRRTVRRIPLDQRAESPGQAEQRQQAERRERDRQNDPQPWVKFKSLTITKMDDGQYKAEIDFRDKDERILHRDYFGTREEIRQAIQDDKALPESEREHLLRSLDQQSPGVIRFQWPRPWGEFFDFDREMFNWPNLDF